MDYNSEKTQDKTLPKISLNLFPRQHQHYLGMPENGPLKSTVNWKQYRDHICHGLSDTREATPH
jgi:hypothetical protein